MTQGMIQTLLIRLPFAYVMSIQPDASLTMIGLAAPVSTTVGVVMCAVYYWHMNHKKVQPGSQERGEVEVWLYAVKTEKILLISGDQKPLLVKL